MPDQPSPPEPPRTVGERARHAAVRAVETFTVKQLALGAFLVVLVLSVPFGGMRAVARDKPAEVKLDKEVSAAPFTITLKGAWQTDDMPLPAAGKTEGRYVIVGALVRTSEKTSVPRQTLVDALRLRGEPAAGTIAVDGDGHAMGDLPPRTTYGLYWVFTLPPGTEVPTRAEVSLRKHTHRESSLDQTLGWFDPATVARARLPIETWQPLQQTPAQKQAQG